MSSACVVIPSSSQPATMITLTHSLDIHNHRILPQVIYTQHWWHQRNCIPETNIPRQRNEDKEWKAWKTGTRSWALGQTAYGVHRPVCASMCIAIFTGPQLFPFFCQQRAKSKALAPWSSWRFPSARESAQPTRRLQKKPVHQQHLWTLQGEPPLPRASLWQKARG